MHRVVHQKRTSSTMVNLRIALETLAQVMGARESIHRRGTVMNP
jgi:hypothetical protein